MTKEFKVLEALEHAELQIPHGGMASSLQCRGYRYIEAFEMAQILHRGADLRRLEGVITCITVCSMHSSIYSERLVSLPELIEGTYGEPIAATSGHGSSGMGGRGRGVVGGS